MTYSAELIVTLAVLLGAVLWAARRFYRWTRRTSSQLENAGSVSGCKEQHDTCGRCPVVTLLPESDETPATRPRNGRSSD